MAKQTAKRGKKSRTGSARKTARKPSRRPAGKATAGRTIADGMTPMPHTVRADMPLVEAQAIIRDLGIRHLPVLDGEKLVGILSERNVKAGLAGPSGDKFLVEDAMMPDVFAVPEDTPIAQVVQAMADEKFGSAVVTDDSGRVSGIFTTVDACRLLAELLR